MPTTRLAFLIGFASLLTACGHLSEERYLVCPYDAVWEASLDTMKQFPVTVKDKQKGVIETNWIEFEGKERPYGIFQRNAFGNRERARMVLTLSRHDEVTAISVAENRERWHLRGGAASGSTRWWPIEPSQETMAAVMSRITAKLRDRGCTPS